MIALLGEDRGHRSHQELNALRPQLAELGAPVHPLVRAVVSAVGA